MLGSIPEGANEVQVELREDINFGGSENTYELQRTEDAWSVTRQVTLNGPTLGVVC